MKPLLPLVSVALLLLAAPPSRAQSSPSSAPAAAPVDADADLATQLANPVASLISVPLQNNLDFGIGPNDATRFTLNVQPVVPFALNEDWSLITRTILPVINAESPAPGVPSVFGLGDTAQSFFVSPREPVGGWILGAGPVGLYPTATEELLGSGKWGLGPTGVALQQKGHFTYGALANHLWSVGGESDRADVSATFINPFVSYITGTKTTFTLSPELTYDWENQQWLAPINLVVSQLFTPGNQPVSVALGARYYAEGLTGGPEWGLRFNVVLLFPK